MKQRLFGVSLPLIAIASVIAGCGGAQIGRAPDPAADAGDASAHRVPLFSGATALQDGWQHVRLRGATDWRLVALDGTVAIRAEGQSSASGLFRYVETDHPKCTTGGTLHLRWRVDAVQTSSDLTERGQEDVGAGLFLLFGDPGMLSDPQPVPTLRYVWAGVGLPVGTVVDSPYLPGVVRSIVLRNETASLGEWATETRDLAADFRAAFDREPTDPVQAIALFTDNDQTGEPAIAHYGNAEIVCPTG